MRFIELWKGNTCQRISNYIMIQCKATLGEDKEKIVAGIKETHLFKSKFMWLWSSRSIWSMISSNVGIVGAHTFDLSLFYLIFFKWKGNFMRHSRILTSLVVPEVNLQKWIGMMWNGQKRRFEWAGYHPNGNLEVKNARSQNFKPVQFRQRVYVTPVLFILLNFILYYTCDASIC